MPTSSQENSRKKIIEAIQHHQNQWTVESLLTGITSGDVAALSSAITFSESTLPAHRILTDGLIERLPVSSTPSFRIGITGVPGVGKSTLIEQLGLQWISEGFKVAVLAIDPTSPITHGSILGDKTRMEQLSLNTNAFIRPSPSSLSLGGVATHTHEAVLLCEAAGYNRIIIETVGVGQSEVAVHHLTDCFLLLMLAGAGDQLQGIKRGIMEMCDMMAITKADQQNEMSAKKAQAEYQQALHLFPARADGWIPQVLTTSHQNHQSIVELRKALEGFYEWSLPRQLNEKRQEQKKHLLQEEWNFRIHQHFQQIEGFNEQWKKMESQLTTHQISLSKAIETLLQWR
jgi:LAO/AO transport system kinase